MRDRPHPNHRLEWPGGVVPEWARPQQNSNRRRKGKGPGGGERNGGSSPGKRERLQKVMAQSGHGSRRNIEILIAQGHITINGQIAKLGDSVGPGDKVKLDGNLITLRFGDPLPRVLLYHKQAGPTVFDRLPKVHGGRWVSVGRLDFNTEGLLIFTTNGELANRLTHPRYEVEREYAVRTMGELTEEQRTKLLTAVEIDGESCRFDSLEERGGEGSNRWYHVVLREGKNREVRRMMETVGLMVSRLIRVRFGDIELPGFLKRGMMKEMEEEQVQELFAAAMAEAPEREGAAVEEVDDEFDNIGNRVTEANRDRRLDPEEDLGDDDLGNRADTRPQPAEPREADGNRGTYDLSDRPDPLEPGARRAHGKQHGFGKKRMRGDEQPGQYRSQGQPGQRRGQGQQHGQGQPGQHHGQGQRKQKHRKGRGQQGQQGGQQGQQGQPGQHAQPGQAPQQGAPVQGGGQGPQGQGPQQQRPPGQGKPGRHRRHKNRNRNRNPAEARGDQQPGNNANRNSGEPRGDAQPGNTANRNAGETRGDQQPSNNSNREPS